MHDNNKRPHSALGYMTPSELGEKSAVCQYSSQTEAGYS
ncbi:hypothetical protein KWH73_15885 [Enterobacter roggenkampii]|nr:hypothetical protein [Enterobacter roggenkampii]